MNTVNLKFPKDFFKTYAKGKPCMVRIASTFGHSCASEETTVLAHITLPGMKAMGKKLVPDLCGAWACATCHGIVDGQIVARPYLQGRYTKSDINLFFYEGVMRTLDQLVRDGVLPNP